MSDTSLIFNLLAIDRASEKILGVHSAFGKLAVGAAAAGAKFADTSIHMAADFEASQLRLVTTAGESEKALSMVNQGVLNMAGPVATGPMELSKALYTVESAGFHAADGLKVLEAATKGAKVEGADAKEVADAVSSALVDYHLSADHAAEVTNTLIAAVGHGKTTMQDLSAAMPNVLAAAAAAKVPFQEAAAALATMTQHGTDASTAGTYLRQVILGLENPTTKARGVMRSLGLDANDVSMNLGKNGLASTISMVEEAINTHLSPAGLVAVSALKKSSGSVTAFQAALANLPQGQKTAIGALADMVGGVKNLQGFLQLGGENLKVFEANTASVREQVAAGGKDIDGWSKYQQTYNYKLDSAKASMQALQISIGTALLPKAKELMDVIKESVDWLGKHQTVASALATTIGVLGSAYLSYKAYLKGAEIATTLWGFATKTAAGETKLATVATKAWAAAQWLFNAAMDANPIGLVIIAVAALAVGIWYLWTHSKGFRDFFIGMWNDIWGFLKAVGAWFAGPFADFFVGVFNTLKSAGELWWHTFSGFWLGVWHGAEAAASGIHHAWSATINFFTSLPGKIGAALVKLPGELERAAKKALDAMLYAIGYGIGLAIKGVMILPGQIAHVWDILYADFTRGVDIVVGVVERLPGEIEHWFIDTYHRASSWVAKTWDDFYALEKRGMEIIIQWISQLPGKVEHWFIDTYNKATHWVAKTWDDFYALEKRGMEIIIQWISQLPGKVEHWFIDTYNKAIHWASSATNDTIGWFEQLPGRAWNAFSSMVSSIWRAMSGAGQWLYNAGSDIIMGLIHGVEDAIDGAVHAVAHGMGQILKGAKDALGISSPSKVFAAEVGHWIPHGIADGVRGAARVAHDAVSGLMGGMVYEAKVDAVTPPGAPGSGYPGGGPAGYPRGGTVINITVNAGIGTDGQEVGERIAEVLRPVVRGRYGGNVQVALGGAQ